MYMNKIDLIKQPVEKDRMITILVTPFLTCGAKLPVMALFGRIYALFAVAECHFLASDQDDAVFFVGYGPYRANMVFWMVSDRFR